MANQSLPRYEIVYFDGVNTEVGDNLAKRNELSFCRNARSQIIGVIEKRKGYLRLGNNISATVNYGMHYFEDTNTSSSKFFRVSKVSNAVSLYYLNTSSVWTSMSADTDATNLFRLGDSTTQFDITNPSGTTYRYTWDTTGTDPDIDGHVYVGDTLIINAQNFTAANNGTFAITGVAATYFDITNASGVAENNKTIGTGSIIISSAKSHFITAENCAFMVNGRDANRYIEASGTSVVTSATASGHLYNSPVARKINYYKGRLYLGDYLLGTTRYENKVMRSSEPLGIVALVDGDHTQPITSLKVTDTKYIQTSDSLDIYRGGTKIGTITVTAKTEDTLTISSFGTNINSADEVWVANTYTGTRVFRWPDNAASGSTDAKQYDTFTVSGGDNDALNMMTNIGGIMVMANDNNMATWNDSSLETLDYGIGCVSERGYIKSNGVLFFVHYRGVYATTGARPQLMSAKVEQYFTGATKAGLNASAAGKKGNSVFFSIGDVTLYNEDGSTYKSLVDVVLEYNLRQENWFVHTNISVDQFQTMIGGTDPDRLMLSDADDFNIYEFLNGTVDRGTTSDLPIFFDITSKKISMDTNFESIVYPRFLVVEILRGSGIEAFIALDDEDFYQIGEANKGVNIISIISRNSNSFETTPRCRKIKWSLRESSIYLCKIGKVAVVYGSVSDEEIAHE